MTFINFIFSSSQCRNPKFISFDEW